jgi:hypothetical protein
MGSRFLVGTVLMVSALATGAVGTSADRIAPARQSAIVYLTEPTLVGSTIVQGPVLFVHDGVKMSRHEPCTTVYLFEPGVGPKEEVASFHCIPTTRKAVATFTITTKPNTTLGIGCILTAYQFANDTESHGVPAPANGH